MKNPLAQIKNTRQTYNKTLDEVITEVLVQFRDEPETWIPYHTLLAIHETKTNS